MVRRDRQKIWEEIEERMIVRRERKKIGREKRKNDSGKRERKILKTDLEKVGQ